MRHIVWRRVLAGLYAVAMGAALAVGGHVLAQAPENFDNVQIDIVPVRGGVYMLVGAGGNTTIHVGDDGVLVVDTQFAPLSTEASCRDPVDQQPASPLRGQHTRA